MFHTLQGTSPYPIKVGKWWKPLVFSVGYVSSFSGGYVCLFLPLASSIFVSRRFARFPISNGSKWHPIKETNHRIIEPNCFRKPLQSQYQKLTFCLYFWNSSKRKNIQYWNLSFAEFQKKHNLRGQLFYVSCRTSSLGFGIPIQKLLHQTEASANTCPGRAQS